MIHALTGALDQSLLEAIESGFVSGTKPRHRLAISDAHGAITHIITQVPGWPPRAGHRLNSTLIDDDLLHLFRATSFATSASTRRTCTYDALMQTRIQVPNNQSQTQTIKCAAQQSLVNKTVEELGCPQPHNSAAHIHELCS